MSAIMPFAFESHHVRVLLDTKGDPWFVAQDICQVLEIAKPENAVVVKFFWTRRSGGGVMHRRATGWQGWPAFHTARVIGSQVLNAIGYCYKS